MRLISTNGDPLDSNPSGDPLYNDLLIYSFGLSFAGPDLSGRRTGRPSDTVIFGNEEDYSFDNPHFQAALNGDTYDNTSALDGSDGSTSTKRTITARLPELGNRIKPLINPTIQRTMSGQLKTLIVQPVQYDISFTWKLHDCNDVLFTSLLGLITFEQIRLVVGDNTYLVTLLDDSTELVREKRDLKSITLNFRGVKL